MRAGVAPAALRLVSRTVRLDDPGELIARLPDPDGIVWVRGGEGFVGWGEAARLEVGTGEGRFRRAAAALRDLLASAEVEDQVGMPGTGPIAFGSFTFDPASGSSWLIVPSVVLGRRGGQGWLTLTGPGDLPDLREIDAAPAGGPASPLPARAALDEEGWVRAVGAAREAVRRGMVGKVVLARDLVLDVAAPLDPRTIARRLARDFPECYTFAGRRLVGSSPELLVRRRGRAVVSVTLGGSAARGLDAASDEALGRELLGSAKDRREHALAVASVREPLEALCAGLSVAGEPRLLRLPNVQHLSTTIEGRLHAPITALELAGVLHPTAAVCGTPTRRALALIRSLEPFDRGAYAGPVGWVDAAGDGEWAIALRCAEVRGARARLFAGAGIVGESDPEAELEETRVKLGAMLAAIDA